MMKSNYTLDIAGPYGAWYQPYEAPMHKRCSEIGRVEIRWYFIFRRSTTQNIADEWSGNRCFTSYLQWLYFYFPLHAQIICYLNWSGHCEYGFVVYLALGCVFIAWSLVQKRSAGWIWTGGSTERSLLLFRHTFVARFEMSQNAIHIHTRIDPRRTSFRNVKKCSRARILSLVDV